MLSKNEFKTLSKYKQDKYRRQDGVFVVEGVKLTQELLLSDYEVVKICALESWFEVNQSIISERFSKQTMLSNYLTVIGEDQLAKLSLLSTPNKVWCVARKPKSANPTVQGGLIILLDGIKDPGNLGTIVRLADWFNVERLVCTPDCVDLFNPKTVQSTMGSIFRVKVHYQEAEEFFNSLPKDYAVCGSLVECGDSVYSQSLSERSVLITGSESHGISPEVRQHITQVLNIPCFKTENRPESLNAAIACSILVSEFRRLQK